MKRVLLLSSLILGAIFFHNSARAADTKAEGRIYATWWMYMNDTLVTNDDGDVVDQGGYNQFSLDRSYMTLRSKLSEYTSVNITGDLRSTSGYSGYDLILKYGYASVIMPFHKPLSLTLGLQRTRYPDFVDNMIWGRRYLERNVGDRVGFLTTSDLGATFDHQIGAMGNMGSVGLSIWNGTSYSNLTENNKNKDFNLYAALKPLVNNADFMNSAIGAQFYTGTRNVVIDTSMVAGDYKRQIVSLGAKVNYRDYFDFGFDYWMNTLGQGPAPAEDLKQNAVMIFGALYFKNMVSETSLFRTLNLLVRYDMYDPDTDSGPVEDNQNLMIVGIECSPVKGINASLNYRTMGFESSAMDSQNYLYFNTEFKF
jgi:hypothetical protein